MNWYDLYSVQVRSVWWLHRGGSVSFSVFASGIFPILIMRNKNEQEATVESVKTLLACVQNL